MKIPWNVFGDSNDENNFKHKLLLRNTQVSKLRKAFANNSLANIKSSKTQLHKIKQSGWFSGGLLGPLLKAGLLLIGNVFKPSAKSILIPLELTAASATDPVFHQKMFGFGNTMSTISSEEMNDIMKIVKSIEEFGLWIKGVCETIKSEAKQQKLEFLGKLLDTLGASVLGNLFIGKEPIATSQRHGTNMLGGGAIRAGEGTIRAGQDF